MVDKFASKELRDFAAELVAIVVWKYLIACYGQALSGL